MTKKRVLDTKSVHTSFPSFMRENKGLFLAASGLAFCLVIVVGTLLTRLKPARSTQQGGMLSYDNSNFVRPKELPTATPSAKPFAQMRIPIIMYHYVEYVRNKKDYNRIRLNTTPKELEEHLVALKDAGYETYFVKDIPDILSGQVDYATRSAVLSFDDGYEDFYLNVFPLLKKHHMRATLYLIYDFIGRKEFLTRKQIQELIDSDLIEIGSHTLTHRYLKTASPEDVRREVFDSKKRLEDDFHISVKTFAYPNGAMSAYAVQAVEDAGYTAAVSVIPGTIQSEDNLFLLSRVRPGSFTSETLIFVLEQMKK